ncbi:FG-GAP repeat domain-containing protein [Aestuariimicrobium sp. T2.26MG-19.2B]|uniref:FG-GAP repeat domain-containing protein n=1 Tax=Aestuariimicrobium sp. T2.26MG-19.2B TaxID=3040679 RepID=UPI0024778F7B|nr:VCBS repeat-containing protein [Aestuariimicrobium sp. T2.26MG-19.2B]CAI9405849.1 hypothetical protein AESSP_01501 [Aestuariimicrobium sp. T2.26MG-19.2B]
MGATRIARIALATMLVVGLGLAGGVAHAADDFAAPVVTASTVTPMEVDVTTDAQQVTIAVTITDETGTEAPTAVVSSPDTPSVASVALALSSGTAQSGTWTGTYSVAARAKAGQWTVNVGPVRDTLGNQSASAIAVAGFTVVVAPDTMAPQTSNVSTTPSIITLPADSNVVTVALDLADPSGVLSGSVHLEDPAGNPQPSASLARSSGTELNGRWGATLRVPADTAASGTWTVVLSDLKDKVGNVADPITVGNVGVRLASTDTTPPTLVSSSVSPSSVDVTSAWKVVVVQAQLSDPSGVRPPMICVYVQGGICDPDYGMTLVSGTAVSGTWRAQYEVPVRAQAGTWIVKMGPASDAVGNTWTAVKELARFTVVNTPDVAAPVVVDSFVSPSSIDASLTDAQVVVLVRIKDASGTNPPTLALYDSQGFVTSEAMELYQGTPLDGWWIMGWTIPKGTTPWALTFRFDAAGLSDIMGNNSTTTKVVGTAKVMPTFAATGRFGEHTGDSFADIYAADSDGFLSLFRTTSTGLSRLATYLVQIGDWSGDRRSDTLVRRADNSLWIYRSSASGGLYPWRKVGQNWGGMDKIVFAGKLSGSSTQYVVARQKSTGLLYRYQMSNTGLSSGVKIGSGWSGMRFFFSVGDFNGDGRGDIIGVRSSDGTMWFYAGRTNGTLAGGVQVGRGWGGFAHAFSPGDMSGDGRFDLVGVNSSGVLYGYKNNGRGGWSAATQLGTGFKGYTLLA